MTVAEFEKRYMDRPYELWDGRLVKTHPKTLDRALVCYEVVERLQTFNEAYGLGEVLGPNVGFTLSPMTLHAPDIAFVGSAKMKKLINLSGFMPFTPDLAVETVSHRERANTFQRKIELYTDAKTPLVWAIFMDEPRVVVYELNKPFRVVPINDTLDGADVLPGFEIAVADLFSSIAKYQQSKGDA